MMKLDNFINMMTGHFNNKEQFDNMQREGKTYLYAEHINTICNEKIMNLPKDFNGKFVVDGNNWSGEVVYFFEPLFLLACFCFFFSFIRSLILKNNSNAI
jgi:hypothetical protein